MINIVEKHSPREYTAIASDNGIIICDKNEGAFIVLRFKEDIERLISLLNTLHVKEIK